MPKRPHDAIQLAKLTVDIATGETNDGGTSDDVGKDPAAVERGRLGGIKGWSGPIKSSNS